jgi:hypothetical protein
MLPASLMLLLVTGPSSTPASPEAGVQPSLLGMLERETAGLVAELELVRQGGFYLRLDARRARLSLMLEGVVLQEHPLESLETAMPQVLFWSRPPPADWDLRTYGSGTLEPERGRDRVQIVAPTPSPAGDEGAREPSPPPIPPTAEEAYSVPSRYQIRFPEGPTLEITATDGGRNRSLLQRTGDAIALRAGDLASAPRAHGARRVRLRLHLSAEDAATLYRALPPDVSLLVVGLAPH